MPIRAAREHALEEADGPVVVAETGREDARRVEVELRGAHRIALDTRFLFQRRRQRGEVGVRRQVRHVGRAHRPDRWIEPHRALERTTGRLALAETPLEDLRALDVQPRRQLRLRAITIGHARQVRRQELRAPRGALSARP